MQKEIAARITEVCDATGLSRRQIAGRIGVDHTFLGAAIQGRSMPSIVLVVGLAREFQVSPTWLLTGAGLPRVDVASRETAAVPLAAESSGQAYLVEAVIIDGRRLDEDDATVHRDLQVVLDGGGRVRGSTVSLITSTAELLADARDAPARTGQPASGGGSGPAGTGRRSA